MFRNRETSVNISNTQRRKQINETTSKNPRLSGRQRYLVPSAKLVNPLIYTIEYGRRTGFSSREEAEESYQRSLTSYQDQLSKLKKERDMPFTFSEYLDYWLNDVCAHGSNGSRTLVQKQWTINLIIQPHLHKDILLGCVTPDYLNKVLESCQAYCCNGGYYAYSCCIVL